MLTRKRFILNVFRARNTPFRCPLRVIHDRVEPTAGPAISAIPRSRPIFSVPPISRCALNGPRLIDLVGGAIVAERLKLPGWIGRQDMREAANHRRRTALAKCLGLMAFTILGLVVPAAGQDRTRRRAIGKLEHWVVLMRCWSWLRQLRRLVVGRDNQPTTLSTKRLQRSMTSSWQTPPAISRAQYWKTLSATSQPAIAKTPTMNFFAGFAAPARIKFGSR